MRLKYKTIEEAFFFGDVDGVIDHRSLLSLETGKIHLQSDYTEEELPENIDDETKFVELPKKSTLGLGKPTALEFAREFLPDAFDDVQDIFRKKGAFRKFKNLLDRKNMLDAWYKFENEELEYALRRWCRIEGIELED